MIFHQIPINPDSFISAVQKIQNSVLHLNCKIVIIVINFYDGLFVNSVTVIVFGTINVFSSLVGGPMYPHSNLIHQNTLGKLGIAFVHGFTAFFPHGVLLPPSLTLECPL